MSNPIENQYKTSANLQARIAIHERFSTSKQEWMHWVFDRIEAPAEGRILEIGCGTGKLWKDNLERVPAGWRITLSDFSAGMIEQAQGNLASNLSQFEFQRFDATRLPFEDDFFDVVIANHMLYHVPDLHQTLAEIRRVLRPGGILYAATNGTRHMLELDDLIGEIFDYVPSRTVIHQFILDNGRESLEAHFDQVTLEDYEDGLLINEVEPIVDYVFSRVSLFEPAGIDLSEARAQFTKHLEGKMAAEGVIRITKETGLFMAR